MEGATLIPGPNPFKNRDEAHDPETHSSQRDTQLHLGMKTSIDVNSDFWVAYAMRGTSGNAHDMPKGWRLLPRQENNASCDAGYPGVDKRHDAIANVTWHMAMHPGTRRARDKYDPLEALTYKIEKATAGIRTKVEHPLRLIKRQFVCEKTCYFGLKRNAGQLVTPFELSNQWQVHGKLTETYG